MQLIIKTNDGKEIELPIQKDDFTKQKPLIINFKDDKGREKIYYLRITQKNGLCLN